MFSEALQSAFDSLRTPPIATPALGTPWDHNEADPTRTSERYNAHNTGAILDRLISQHGWVMQSRYTRRSHDVRRRPFALHAAVLSHPEASTFEALGRTWKLGVYLRNAHDSTAALNASLLLTSGRVQSATAYALAPASFRAGHIKCTNDQAQELAMGAAKATPDAVMQLMAWQRTSTPGGYSDAMREAFEIRFPGEQAVLKTGEAHHLFQTLNTKLDYYLAMATLTLEGRYYLETSKRMVRDVKNIQTREQTMRAVWELMNAKD
jgi:hypothetical protein